MPRNPPQSSSTRTASQDKPCRYCGLLYKAKGLSSHEKSCGKKRQPDDSLSAFLAAIQAPVTTPAEQSTVAAQYTQRMSPQQRAFEMEVDEAEETGLNDLQPPGSPIEPDFTNLPPGTDDSEHEEDPDLEEQPPFPSTIASSNIPGPTNHVKIVYHPTSLRPTQLLSTDDFCQRHIVDGTITAYGDGALPWRPFVTRVDFELSELALDAGMTAPLIQRLLNITCSPDRTLQTSADVTKAWEFASNHFPKFFEKKFDLAYRNRSFSFTVHARSLLEWCDNLLMNPRILKYIVWDAERVYRRVQEEWIRMYGEPWTGDRWWDIQSRLPKCPITSIQAQAWFFYIYADKTRLSSFGSEKGHPVVVRPANLPRKIRNGESTGGGVVIGWLPIVDEEQEFKKQPGYINFKRVIWHTSFLQILESLIQFATLGRWVEDGNGTLRWLFYIILAIVSDYEEQCFFALIRGCLSNYPCPICLVKHEDLHDLSQSHARRTAEDSRATLTEAREQATKKAKEEILMTKGLRDVENAFWQMGPHSDPHEALAFDRLHFFDGGIFSDHLWNDFGIQINRLGLAESRPIMQKINEQMDLFPRWRNLNHFSHVMEISFTDGTKYEDISRCIIFAAHNTIDRRKYPILYTLLLAIRSYVEMNMYAALPMHSDTWLDDFEHSMLSYNGHMKDFTNLTPTKDPETGDEIFHPPNYPKAHLALHCLDDIRRQGATRNYTTKPYEKMHGPLKEAYRLTNFKNVASQILRRNHTSEVSDILRERIDAYDALQAETQKIANAINNGDDEGILESIDDGDLEVVFNASLGARKAPVTIRYLESLQRPEFRHLRSRLQQYLREQFFPSYYPSTDAASIIVLMDTTVIECRFVKVLYNSVVDWEQHCDYLRCNPSFHGHSRYDFAIINAVDANGEDIYFFAQLLFVFAVDVVGTTCEIALIRAIDAKVRLTAAQMRRDKEFGFYRIRPQTPESYLFIPIQALVRGAVCMPDFSMPEGRRDYLVVDTIDSDMFIRLRTMYKCI